MLAAFFTETGPMAQVIQIGDMSEPELGSQQVLVSVTARTVQPADYLFVGGRYRIKAEFPQIAGFEGVGHVVAVGTDISGPVADQLTPGTRVAFRAVGAWAEQVAVPVNRIYPVPEGVPDSVASQFALNPLTAYGLLQRSSPVAGSRLLVTAGRSVVAGLLTQLALERGISVSLLVRDKQRYQLLDGASNQRLEEAASIAETLKHRHFDVVMDAVGGPATTDLIAAITSGGQLLSYGALDNRPFTIDTRQVTYKLLRWQGFGIDAWLNELSHSELDQAQQQIWSVLERQPQLLPVAATFPLVDIHAALAKDSTSAGKVILI